MMDILILALAFLAGAFLNHVFLGIGTRLFRSAKARLAPRPADAGREQDELAGSDGAKDRATSEQGGSKLDMAKAEVMALLDAKLSRMVELEDEMIERESITRETSPQSSPQLRSRYFRLDPYALDQGNYPRDDSARLHTEPSELDRLAECINARLDAMSNRFEGLQYSIGRLEAVQLTLVEAVRHLETRQTNDLSGPDRVGRSTQLSPMVSSLVKVGDDVRPGAFRQAKDAGIQFVSRIRRNLNNAVDTFLRRG